MYWSIDPQTELRLWTSPDAPTLYQLIVENRDFLRPWFSFPDAIQSISDAGAYIQRQHERWTQRGEFWAGLWSEQKLAGAAGVYVLDRDNASAELGYWLGVHATGQGLATRACRTLLDYLFDEVRVNRIVIQCGTTNHTSIAVAERLGFQREGILRKAQRVGEGFRDMVVYSLLAEEWNRQRGPSMDQIT
jgi:ribosomal-protein-serine acetyltransferase